MRRGAGISDAHAFLDRHFQKVNTNPNLMKVAEAADTASRKCRFQTSKTMYGAALRDASKSQGRLKKQQTVAVKGRDASLSSVDDNLSPSMKTKADFQPNGSEEEHKDDGAGDAKDSSARKGVRLSRGLTSDGNQEARMVSPGRPKNGPPAPQSPMSKQARTKDQAAADSATKQYGVTTAGGSGSKAGAVGAKSAGRKYARAEGKAETRVGRGSMMTKTKSSKM